MQIYFLVYQLTNLVNGKIYIGCHITKNLDDGYMGSGKRIGYAKKKYGVAAFKKEILSVHETLEEMFAEEAKIVNEDFLKRKDVYNLACGGYGSWFFVNANKKLTPEFLTKLGTIGGKSPKSTLWKVKMSARFKGKPLSEAHKAAIKSAIRCPLSEAHKAAISSTKRGKPMSEAHKAAISKAMKCKH